jgi:hypothetical protein
MGASPTLRAFLVVLAAGCTEPHYGSGHLHCATSGKACPDDFYCGADGLCWANGSGPDLSTAEPDLAGLDLFGVDFADIDLSMPDLAKTSDLFGADLAGVDLGVTPSLCSSVSVMMCDGFEGASIDGRWTQNMLKGGFSIDTTRAYRGASSLHVHTDQITSSTFDPGATLRTSQNFNTLTPGTIYVRAFAFLQAPFPSSFNQLLNFATNGGEGAALATAMGSGHIAINDYAGTPIWNESTTGMTLATGRWLCLQFGLPIGMSGTATVSVDGNHIDTDLVIPTPQPIPDHIYCGLDFSQTVTSQGAADLWLDEIIVDNKPTSCSE